MELTWKTYIRKIETKAMALSLARVQRATCANETAEKWPENGPTDSPVVNPDCKRAFIIRRPGEGEGEREVHNGEPRGRLVSAAFYYRGDNVTSRIYIQLLGGSPEFLPSLRSRFFFSFFFFFSFSWQRDQQSETERLHLEFYCFYNKILRWVGSMDFLTIRLSRRSSALNFYRLRKRKYRTRA